MSRRDFAKVSAAAAGFAILSSRSRAQETNSDTLKVGLLGCGGRGGGAASQMLLGNENVQLVALADVFQDRVDAKRAEFTQHENPAIRDKVALDDEHCFAGLEAYKQIIASDIDILIDGTLPYCRPTHLVAAMEAGKHIFTEKPIAVDPVGIRQVIEAGRKHKDRGLSFVAGTQRRHDKAYRETIQRIHDGEIGDVVAGRAYWCGNLPFVHDRKPGMSDLEYRIRNWYGYCWVAGDNIVEQHVHNLDIMNWVFGANPVSVVAMGGRTWKPDEEKYGDIYDHFACDYEYPGGVHVISMSRHWSDSYNEVSELVTGTKGQSNCRDMGEPGIDPYVQEHINLVNSIRNTGPKWHEAEQVSESTLVAIMGRESAYTGKKITWDEIMNSDLSLVPEVLDFDREYPVRPVPRPGAPK